MNYACPCCGYLTRSDTTLGTSEICPVCFWEDDDAQTDDPESTLGANTVSLRIARKNFTDFGASERRFIEHVRRPHASELAQGSPKRTLDFGLELDAGRKR